MLCGGGTIFHCVSWLNTNAFVTLLILYAPIRLSFAKGISFRTPQSGILFLFLDIIGLFYYCSKEVLEDFLTIGLVVEPAI